MQEIRIGRFTLLEFVGRGGMGVLYAVAHDKQLDRRVVLKLLGRPSAPELRARLQRDARALARLNHPNVVPVFEVGEHEGQLFIVMEFVRGITFRRWIAESKPDLPRILETCLQAGRGLAAAHEAGLVHRDFKPEAMLVDEDGRVRVLDFGLAIRDTDMRSTGPVGPDRLPTRQEGNVFDTLLTLTGSILGTPAYMAPEQMLGESADHRADQFAFCIVLWEALCGERPFPGDNVSQLVQKVVDGKVRPPPRDSAMPPWLRPVLERGLSRRSAHRWDSMEALLVTIERGGVERRHRWSRALGGALVAVGAATGAVSWAAKEVRAPPPDLAMAAVSGHSSQPTAGYDVKVDRLKLPFYGNPPPGAQCIPDFAVPSRLDWEEAIDYAHMLSIQSGRASELTSVAVQGAFDHTCPAGEAGERERIFGFKSIVRGEALAR